MKYFNTADWLVIISYLTVMIGIGMWAARGQKSTKDYFLGNKNIGWFGIGLSIVAAETSALTIIGVPGLAYGDNMSFIQIIYGYVIARIILAVVMVPHYLKGEIYSPYQLLEQAFGPLARRWAGGIFLVMETLAAGVILGDEVLGGFTKPFLVPWMKITDQPIPLDYSGDPILGAILLFVFLSLIYTYFGGVKAVIWTDAVQFCLFLAGGLFTLYYIPQFIDGGFMGAYNKAVAAGKVTWANWEFSLAAPKNVFNLWMGVLGGTFVVLSTHGAEQLIVQRVLACKNVSDGRKALITSAVLILPLFLIFLLCGILLWAFYQTHPMQIPLPDARPGIKQNDFIFPIFMVTEVPHVLKGFLIVAILSAAMSSISSALTSLASVSTMDFVKGMMRARSEDYYFKFSRYSTVFWAAVLVVVAYASRAVDSVLNLSFALRGMTSGALLGSLILVLLWKNARAIPVVCGMTVSIIVMAIINFFVSWTTGVGPDGNPIVAKVAWPWYTLIGTSITISVAALVRKIYAETSSPQQTR
jgi:solute:Na+ symporter, SSS family